jgi:hypothetical protein
MFIETEPHKDQSSVGAKSLREDSNTTSRSYGAEKIL